MVDEVLYNLGVDINSNFTFQNGDLKLISYDENLVQAVINRLNTRLNTLNLFYEDYGSILTSFFGWKGTNDTISLIKIELENSLKNELRLQNYESEIFYNSDGVLRINLTLTPQINTDITVNLMLNSLGELEIIEEE